MVLYTYMGSKWYTCILMKFKQLINFRKHIIRNCTFFDLKKYVNKRELRKLFLTVNTKLNRNAWFSILNIVSYWYVKCSFPRLHGIISLSVRNIAHLQFFYCPWKLDNLNQVSSMSSMYKELVKNSSKNGNIYIFPYMNLQKKKKKFNFWRTLVIVSFALRHINNGTGSWFDCCNITNINTVMFIILKRLTCSNVNTCTSNKQQC